MEVNRNNFHKAIIQLDLNIQQTMDKVFIGFGKTPFLFEIIPCMKMNPMS